MIKHSFLYSPYLLCSSSTYQMYAWGGEGNPKPQKMKAMCVTKCYVKYGERTRMGFWSSAVPQPYSSADGK